MDVIEASILVAAWSGVVYGLLHFAGYIPRPYRHRLERTELTLTQLPNAVGESVEAALNRVAEKAQADAAKAAAEWDAAQTATQKSAAMSIVRSVGVDRQMQAKVDSLLTQAILGPALPILRQFAPGLADALEENPQLVDVIIENPLFKKYVAPKLQQFLGTNSAQMTVTDSGWGT